MHFLYPALFLGWAALVAVPIILYLFRPRPRTVQTSTLPFFKWLAKEHQDAPWLKWLKHLLSLLLSMLVVLAAAAALGRLVTVPSDESLNTVIVLVDRSASMGTVNGEGESRLEEGLEQIEERLAGLSAGVGVIVMTYDKRPEVLLARSTEPREVKRALESIAVRPIEGDFDSAARLVERLSQLDPPTTVWHVTDEPPGRARANEDEISEAADENVSAAADATDDSLTLTSNSSSTIGSTPSDEQDEQQLEVDLIDVSIPKPINVGITSFSMRRLPFQRGRFEAFVQVSATAEEPVDVELDVKMGQSLIAVRKLTIEPSDQQTLLIPVAAGEAADKTLQLTAKANGDVFAADNVVYARVPQLRPIKVLWVSEEPNPFMELALSTLGADEDAMVLQASPSAWPPKDEIDVVIFDGWLPKQWPTKASVVVIDPPGKLGPVRSVRLEGIGLPVDSLRATDDTHPLLYGVATARIAVTQSVVLEASGPLRPVWVGPQGPLLLAGESAGQRIVVLGFSPQMSENLPLMASFPLLMGNAVYWSAEKEIESMRGLNRRTGTLVPLDGKSISWSVPDKEEKDGNEVPLRGTYAELDRIGLWESDAGEAGSAALLSAKETLLSAAPENRPESAEANSSWLLRGDLLPLLLWAIVGILIVESLLFHRYLAY